VSSKGAKDSFSTLSVTIVARVNSAN